MTDDNDDAGAFPGDKPEPVGEWERPATKRVVWQRARPDCVNGRSMHRFRPYLPGVCPYCGTARKEADSALQSWRYRAGEWSGRDFAEARLARWEGTS